MTSEILVLGATGTTGSRVLNGLRQHGADARGASRSAAGFARFDWNDPKTWADVLRGVTAVYLVGPVDGRDPVAPVTDFLEQAAAAGVRRTVLLSSSALAPSETGPGALPELVRHRMAEFAILRPSWFMSNTLGTTPLAAGIRAGQVLTATDHARVGFIDPADIAAVAVETLTIERSLDAELVLTGPSSHSYSELCALASEITGRAISHHSVSIEQFTAYLIDMGVPATYAPLLAALDSHIAGGSEDRVTDTVEQITGHPPRGLRDFLQAHSKQLAA